MTRPEALPPMALREAAKFAVEVERIIDEYVRDYVWEGDGGCYTPNETELIKDAIMGLTADDDFLAAIGVAQGALQAATEPDCLPRCAHGRQVFERCLECEGADSGFVSRGAAIGATPEPLTAEEEFALLGIMSRWEHDETYSKEACMADFTTILRRGPASIGVPSLLSVGEKLQAARRITESEIRPSNRVLGRRLLSIACAIRVGECARGEAEVVDEAAFALLGHQTESAGRASDGNEQTPRSST